MSKRVSSRSAKLTFERSPNKEGRTHEHMKHSIGMQYTEYSRLC